MKVRLARGSPVLNTAHSHYDRTKTTAITGQTSAGGSDLHQGDQGSGAR